MQDATQQGHHALLAPAMCTADLCLLCGAHSPQSMRPCLLLWCHTLISSCTAREHSQRTGRWGRRWGPSSWTSCSRRRAPETAPPAGPPTGRWTARCVRWGWAAARSHAARSQQRRPSAGITPWYHLPWSDFQHTAGALGWQLLNGADNVECCRSAMSGMGRGSPGWTRGRGRPPGLRVPGLRAAAAVTLLRPLPCLMQLP